MAYLIKSIYIPIVLFLISSICCTHTENKLKAYLGQEFSLQTGQTARIADENLEIRFEKVSEDSRCPRNVTCIWAGRSVAIIEFIQPDQSTMLLLTETGLSDAYSKITHEGYEIAFHLTPYPDAGDVISSDSYRLNIIISK